MIFSIKGNDHETNYNAAYSLPVSLARSWIPSFFLSNQKMYRDIKKVSAMVTFQGDLETHNTKHESRERSLIMSLASMESPWRLKFMRTYRQNTIDAFSSREFLLNDALPTLKHSVALEYEVFNVNQLLRLTTELALPLSGQNRSANFLKCELRHQQRWQLVADKINFICDI